MTTLVGEPHYFIRRSHKDLKEGELPTRHVLDRATDRHPVAVEAWDPNIPSTVVFNSLALRQLGITRDLPDRIGNVCIEKDETGDPTGRLHGAVTNGYSGEEFSYQLWRKIPLRVDSELMLDATRRAIAFHYRGLRALWRARVKADFGAAEMDRIPYAKMAQPRQCPIDALSGPGLPPLLKGGCIEKHLTADP